MSLIQGGVEKALSLLGSAPTVAAQKAHLDWLREQLLAAEKKYADLESENTQLLRENRELQKELSVLKKEVEYLDLGMCVLKANPAGGYFDTPLCPSCKKPLSKFATGHLVCGSCAIKLDPMAVNAAVKKALAS